MAQLKNTTVDGSLSVSGGVNTDGSMTVGSSLMVEGGQFELYGTDIQATPYIDFHYNGDTGDYTSRIIESASGTLQINGMQVDNGDVYANHFCIPNNYAYRMKDSSGNSKSVMYMSTTNNLVIGQYNENGHTGHTYVSSYGGTVYIRNKVATLYFSTATGTNYTGMFAPYTDGGPLLGGSSHRWGKIYSTSGSIGTSDEREKSNIIPIAEYPTIYSAHSDSNVFEQFFDKLVPKTYTLDIEKTNELHIGFIAQDIVSSMEELGLAEEDLALIDHDYWTDEETGEERDRYGLAYAEFTALNTYIIQKLKKRVSEQDEKIAELENKFAELESKFAELK